MDESSKHDGVVLAWPPSLELPSENIVVVYLDLNHWISLAQASVRHQKGIPFLDVLQACRDARGTGNAMFVLSAAHYAEMLKIKDPAQRRTIAKVMEELTDFATLVSRVVVMELEMATALDRMTKSSAPAVPVSLLGRGVRHAFGIQSGLRFMGPAGDDQTARFREQIGIAAFDALVTKANLMLERGVLSGPEDADVEQLRSLGWSPEHIEAGAKRRAEEEQAQSRRLEGEGPWRRERLRDVIAARELLIELNGIFCRALAARQLKPTDVLRDPESGRAFLRSMPSTEVAMELKTAWHRNRDKPWTPNDIHDIDALSLAVPYCDVVVTEKACHHALTAAELGKRMHTALLRNLHDVPDTLARWRPIRRHGDVSPRSDGSG